MLDAVDAVFRQPAAFRGLTADPTWTVHQPLPDAMPGDVGKSGTSSVPTRKTTRKAGMPVRHNQRDEPFGQAGRQDREDGERLIAQGTRPRDVLILVRQRGPMFEAVIRALKHAQIEVAGADRLVLTEHIAIMDLLVLGDACCCCRMTISRWRRC